MTYDGALLEQEASRSAGKHRVEASIGGVDAHTFVPRESRLLFRLRERFFNRGSDFRRVRRHGRLKTRTPPPIRANKKLREVPLNFAACLRIGRFVRQKLI